MWHETGRFYEDGAIYKNISGPNTKDQSKGTTYGRGLTPSSSEPVTPPPVIFYNVFAVDYEL